MVLTRAIDNDNRARGKMMEEKKEKTYMLFGVETSEAAMQTLFTFIGPVIAKVAEHGALNQWSPEAINAATESAAKGIAWGIKAIKN